MSEDPAADIPNTERLMRDVLRSIFERSVGSTWMDGLSIKQHEGLARAAQIAREQRPTEPLRDDWDAAGLGEIGGVLRCLWPKLRGGLNTVWTSQEFMGVDLARLREF